MNLQFNVITPDRIFLNAQADEIILTTNTGQMGVLPGHAPLITALDIGAFFYKYKSEKIWTSVALMGGFALILQDNITILVNEAESANTIDLQEALQSFESAQQQFLQAINLKQKVSANFALKKARARIKVLT
uniref:ATP synthase epsilon chain, chloroplastic n=1 Tax=Glaukea argentea TaxID=2894057 RepID=A0A386B1K2_9CHLO|nr:ATP synthase CF1 subunit epsilon [Udotea argentea]AYC65585.1 ATP synthase CF1 subunit epsilon [Udotea argentea]